MMPFATMAHISSTNVVIARLLVIDSPEWDSSTARQVVNFPDIIQRMKVFFLTSDRTSGLRRRTLENGQGFLANVAERWEGLWKWYHSRLPNVPTIPEAVSPMPIISQNIEDLSNEQIWQIFFGSGDEVDT